MKNTAFTQDESLIFALSQLPRLDYESWTNVIAGLKNELGAENALSVLRAAGFKDEKRNETEYKLRKSKSQIRFGTVVQILRTHGIDTEPVIAERRAAPAYQPAFQPRHVPVPALRSERTSAIFRFDDEELEEQAAMLQTERNMTHSAAFRAVLCQHPDAKYYRVYRVMVNRNAKNKQVLCSMQQFQHSFKLAIVSVQELIGIVKAGFAFMPAVMRGRERKNEHFAGSELVVVDIDNTITWDEALRMDASCAALFAYTTPSHTPEQHRFRIVFDISGFEQNAEYYQKIVKSVIAKYHADTACSDVARFFYGSTDANVWQGGVA